MVKAMESQRSAGSITANLHTPWGAMFPSSRPGSARTGRNWKPNSTSLPSSPSIMESAAVFPKISRIYVPIGPVANRTGVNQIVDLYRERRVASPRQQLSRVRTAPDV